MSKTSEENAEILIVDDNPANLEVLSNLLDGFGFDVLIAQDGESAIAKAIYDPPDLILLDIMMPGIDGFETCQRLKKNLVTKDIPILFLTALSDTVNKVKGLSIGAVDYIAKPLQQEEVLARVRLHLKLRLMTKTLEQQNQILEQKVAERTAELTQAIDILQKTQNKLLRREAKLRYDAGHDTLTGLANRAAFLQKLEQVIQLQKRDRNYLYAVLFLDLDRFKVINDSFGHLVGDSLLILVGERLKTCVGEPDTVARFGGDEFVILLPDIKEVTAATSIADLIVVQLRRSFQLRNGYEVFIEVSIGIAFGNESYDRPEDLLRDADVAMYNAKNAGKGRYVVFDPAAQTSMLARLQLENELRRGIKRQEFCLYYQPIVSLVTGQVVGFEALVRWTHPERGLISPGLFIPVAEETGLINALGLWIFDEACRQLASWRSQFPKVPLILNVNLSAVQLKQGNLIEQIEKNPWGMDIFQGSLKLEITESCLLETNQDLLNKLQQLKALGMHLCIDDFGTGYSSLSRLHEFPIDTLKIDRSFVKRLDTSNGNAEIVRTIILLARNLEIDVVAEGIETIDQLNRLQFLGCELAQGYLFSRPVDGQLATRFLENPQLFQSQILGRIDQATAV